MTRKEQKQADKRFEDLVRRDLEDRLRKRQAKKPVPDERPLEYFEKEFAGRHGK